MQLLKDSRGGLLLFPAVLVLRVCEYTSSSFDLWSEFRVVACVWPYVYGDGVCSSICRELVCVITCALCLVVSCAGEHA